MSFRLILSVFVALVFMGRAFATDGNSPRSQPLTPADADFDLDGDGLTNAEETEAGTKLDVPDSDGDGVPDGQDGWALDRDLSPPRLPSFSYAILKIDADLVIDLNDSGTTLVQRGQEYLVWKPDSFVLLQPPSAFSITPTCINASGVVAGSAGTDTEWSETSGDPPVTTSLWSERPFKWSAGVVTLLDNFTTSDRWWWEPHLANVVAINDSGTLIGEGSLRVNDIYSISLFVGAIWPGTQAKPFTTIPDANDYDDTTILGGRYKFINAGGLLDHVYARDINASGVVVGHISEEDGLWVTNRSLGQHGVIWEDTALAPFDLGTDTTATAINDNGIVVGSVWQGGALLWWTGTGALWLKKEGSWLRKPLDWGVPYAINNQVQLLSDKFSSGEYRLIHK